MAFFSNIPALFHSDSVSPGELVILSPDDGRHLRALRLKIGDHVQLLDGRGKRSRGAVETMEKQRTVVRVEDTVLEEPEPGAYIGLAVGLLADKSRMEWLVEKSVELGAEAFYPLQSERAEGFLNADRMHRVAVAALKQSQRSWLPHIFDPMGWGQIREERENYNCVLLCHEQGNEHETFAQALGNIASSDRVLVLVGPEGGFSEGEVAAAREEMDARVVTLGSTRLRSETAAISALATLRIMKSEAGSQKAEV